MIKYAQCLLRIAVVNPDYMAALNRSKIRDFILNLENQHPLKLQDGRHLPVSMVLHRALSFGFDLFWFDP